VSIAIYFDQFNVKQIINSTRCKTGTNVHATFIRTFRIARGGRYTHIYIYICLSGKTEHVYYSIGHCSLANTYVCLLLIELHYNVFEHKFIFQEHVVISTGQRFNICSSILS
jgi:hypothetical protein